MCCTSFTVGSCLIRGDVLPGHTRTHMHSQYIASLRLLWLSRPLNITWHVNVIIISCDSTVNCTSQSHSDEECFPWYGFVLLASRNDEASCLHPDPVWSNPNWIWCHQRTALTRADSLGSACNWPSGFIGPSLTLCSGIKTTWLKKGGTHASSECSCVEKDHIQHFSQAAPRLQLATTGQIPKCGPSIYKSVGSYARASFHVYYMTYWQRLLVAF